MLVNAVGHEPAKLATFTSFLFLFGDEIMPLFLHVVCCVCDSVAKVIVYAS